MIAVLLAQTIAVTGGTVYPVSGPKIANATVLIRDGKIAAVGTSVVVPSDATRIDAAGKWVTPGLIDGGGQMGLVEIGAVAGTRDGSLATDSVAASFNVAEGLNPASVLIPVTRIEGITTALAAPAGHLISGQAVLIDLEGATIEQMLVKSPVGLVANLSEAATDAAAGSQRRACRCWCSRSTTSSRTTRWASATKTPRCSQKPASRWCSWRPTPTMPATCASRRRTRSRTACRATRRCGP